MSEMIEVFYMPQADEERERRIALIAAQFRGAITDRDESDVNICLTIEFRTRELAEQAVAELTATGEHVEGPQTYGTD